MNQLVNTDPLALLRLHPVSPAQLQKMGEKWGCILATGIDYTVEQYR